MMFLLWKIIITPHYVNLGILKFPDIVKLHTVHVLYTLIFYVPTNPPIL